MCLFKMDCNDSVLTKILICRNLKSTLLWKRIVPRNKVYFYKTPCFISDKCGKTQGLKYKNKDDNLKVSAFDEWSNKSGTTISEKKFSI